MKKLFTSDKFFLTTVLVAILGILFNDIVVWVVFPQFRSTIVMDVLAVLCVLFLYTSYKRYNKNVMKCLMGALLMIILMRPINTLTMEDPGNGNIVMVFYALLAATLFISHNLINSDRHSSAGLVKCNQILCVLNLICEIVSAEYVLAYIDGFVVKLSYWFGALGFACVVASIVCVESRLDAYRLDREATGWTEEKGYPEGYVHEYEKK